MPIFCQDSIKLYCLTTPSHKILKDKYFLPSIQDDFEIICEEMEQTCETVKFMAEGWTDTTLRKVDLIIRAIHENWGSLFIFSDVDIQFFKPIKNIILKLIQDNDLIIQKNNPEGVLCSGFFVCRGNQKTLDLWTDVRDMMAHDKSSSDQITLNRCIKRHGKKNPYNLTWAYLPNTFFCGGTFTGHLWTPGRHLRIPHDIVMHHANWTRGIANKIAQLEYIKQRVEKLRA